MLVSIIISTFNQEKFIMDAIHSALAQSYKDLEIIVVDDGSTDNTFDLADSVDTKRNYKVVTKFNGGPASAFNEGFFYCHGEWIRWLAGDDILQIHAIRDMLNYIIYRHDKKKQKNTIYYTDYNRIKEDGKFIETIKERENRNIKSHVEKADELMLRFYGTLGTSLIHRTIFEKIGVFDETLKASEDYEFLLRAMVLNGIDIHHIPLTTLNYRIHPDQLSKKYPGTFDDEIRRKILKSKPAVL